jgi:frataxin
MLAPLFRRFLTGFSAFKNDGDFKAKVAEIFFDLGDSLAAKYESRVPDFVADAQEESLSVTASGSQFLLSRQTPSRQIWVASPISGSAKFDFNSDTGSWVDAKQPTIDLRAFLQGDIDVLLTKRRGLVLL